ncbi:MAG: hypothetical protein HY235_08650 [Acidobacteria bacterium]|nr:hypothetical protein [Acidobacteriota bacterium]
MAIRRSAEAVQALLEDYQRSGLRRAEYCRRQGVSVTTLDYYRRRQARKATGRLVKVKVKAEALEAQGVFSLVLANGRRIESSWRFAEAELTRLIQVAETA